MQGGVMKICKISFPAWTVAVREHLSGWIIRSPRQMPTHSGGGCGTCSRPQGCFHPPSPAESLGVLQPRLRAVFADIWYQWLLPAAIVAITASALVCTYGVQRIAMCKAVGICHCKRDCGGIIVAGSPSFSCITLPPFPRGRRKFIPLQ
jgi:hypothetical protein